MIREDYHLHTNFCDGKDSPEAVILSALEKGMTSIGFSGHAYMTIDDCCMTEEGTAEYKREIARLKQTYGGRIRIFCGVEQDYYSVLPTDDYDYVIGSVHYLPAGDAFAAVDYSEEHLRQLADQYYGGDLMAVAEAYYERLGEIAERTGCDIIGHFDLISKYNENDRMFDSGNERYVAAWKKAADRLLACGIPFEINTGAISRGYRKTPYPSLPIRRYLAAHGARFLLSSDSHAAPTLMYQFDEWEQVLREEKIDLMEHFL